MSTAGRQTSGERFFLPDDPLIADFVSDLLRKNRSARTMEAYARDLEHFGRYLSGDTNARVATEAAPAARLYPKLRDASASDIRKYVLFLMMERRYKVVAVRRNLSATSSCRKPSSANRKSSGCRKSRPSSRLASNGRVGRPSQRATAQSSNCSTAAGSGAPNSLTSIWTTSISGNVSQW